MGDGAEDLMFQQINGRFKRNEVKPEKPQWTTADGMKLFISEMDTEHIINCKNLLSRRREEIQCAIDDFNAELKTR